MPNPNTRCTGGFFVCFRADFRNEKIGYKIREAQLQKIPYMLVLGDKEEETHCVTVRDRAKGDIGAMSIDDYIEKVKKESIFIP